MTEKNPDNVFSYFIENKLLSTPPQFQPNFAHLYGDFNYKTI